MATVQTIVTTTSTATTRRALAEERLAAYRKAELAILSSQSYTVDGVTLTRANLADVQKMITKLEDALAAADAGANPFGFTRVSRAVPID